MDNNVKIGTGQFISSIVPKQPDVIRQPIQSEDNGAEWQQPVGDTVNIKIPVEIPALRQKQELPPPPVVKEIVHKDKPGVPAVPLNLFMEDTPLEGTGFAAPVVTGTVAATLARNPWMSPAELKEAVFAEQLGPFGVGEVISRTILDRPMAGPGTSFFQKGINSISDGMICSVDGEILAQ